MTWQKLLISLSAGKAEKIEKKDHFCQRTGWLDVRGWRRAAVHT